MATVERQRTLETAKFDLLVREGLLSSEELDLAAAEAGRAGEDCATALVARRDIPKDSVGKALSAFYKCPYVAFSPELKLAPSLVEGISPHYLMTQCWLP